VGQSVGQKAALHAAPGDADPSIAVACGSTVSFRLKVRRADFFFGPVFLSRCRPLPQLVSGSPCGPFAGPFSAPFSTPFSVPFSVPCRPSVSGSPFNFFALFSAFFGPPPADALRQPGGCAIIIVKGVALAGRRAAAEERRRRHLLGF
jgi:hypothetical protein